MRTCQCLQQPTCELQASLAIVHVGEGELSSFPSFYGTTPTSSELSNYHPARYSARLYTNLQSLVTTGFHLTATSIFQCSDDAGDSCCLPMHDSSFIGTNVPQVYLPRWKVTGRDNGAIEYPS